MSKNISEILTSQALKQPNKVAVFLKTKSYTYKELDTLIDKLAIYLDSKNIKKGDLVVHYFEDEFLLIISMLALAKIGATIIAPSGKLSIVKAQELQEVVKIDCIVSDQSIDFESMKTLTIQYEEFSNISKTKEFITKSLSPWQIVIGSGTTGKEKFFEVSHALEFERVTISKNSLKLKEEDIVASLIGLQFNSTKIRFLATLLAGATYFILDKTISNFPNICKRYKISVLYSTVYYTEMILSTLKDDQKQSLDSLRVFSIGGSTISEELKNKVKEKLTSNLYIGYGTNDIGGITCTQVDTVFNIKQTVGKVLDGIVVQIVDTNDKEVLDGDIGNIRVKSPGMIASYLNDKENTKKFFKNGWFYPGDLGRFTKDKELIYLGRSDHMMILNGINIYPALIENRLLEHDEVEDVACIPLKDTINQDIPIAAVVLKKDSHLTKAFLINFCYQKLSNASVKDIVILEQIPRNNLGKLQRKQLVELMYTELLFKNKKNRQTTKKFTIEINQQEIKNLEYIDLWFEKLFGMVIEQKAQKKDIYNLSHRALFLIRKLLQICKIPVFYLGEIDSIVEKSVIFL